MNWNKSTGKHRLVLDRILRSIGDQSIADPCLANRTAARTLTCTFAVVLFLLVIDNVIGAVPIPPDLQPGDQYQLMFISSTVRDGNSSDVANFDEFVQAAVDSAEIGISEGVNWSAVVSIGDDSGPQINARDHALVSSPVYNMNLDLVASGFADLWDGAVTNSPQWDERGFNLRSDAWTGSQADGTADPFEYVRASLSPDSNTAWCGNTGFTDEQWQRFFNPPLDTPLHVYGLSEELVVPEPNVEVFVRQPGDSNEDREFNTVDIVRVLASGRFETGEPATWIEGDWNGAPNPDITTGPPPGDGFFNTGDVIAALASGLFETGAYAATSGGREVQVNGVPEPSAVVLWLAGCLVMSFVRPRQRPHSRNG